MPLTRPARLIALALLAACCAAFAPAPVYREPAPDRRTDEQKLQGAWEHVSRSIHGHEQNGYVEAIFTGRRLSFRGWGVALGDYSFTLDPTASPKRLDILHGRKGTTLRFIYRLEGDRLTLARGFDWEAPRPANFKSGLDRWVDAYRRAKRGK